VARIFISHSSANNADAIALRDWLAGEGWDDVFIDLDPERGIVAGERWERALNEAANRCEAILFLVTRAWLGSRWCMKELNLAHRLNKRLFGVLIEDVPLAELPPDLTSTWQLVNLAAGSDHQLFRALMPDKAEEAHITFSASGLTRLKGGLTKAGLDPRFFAWPPADEPNRPPYRGLKPLEAEDAGIFFGREAPVIEALDRLRGLAEAAPPRFLVILGASGAGKSSFLRAGLLPRLSRDDRNFLPLPVVRPDRAGLTGETGLVRSLDAAFQTLGSHHTRAEVKAAIDGGAQTLMPLLTSLAETAHPPAMPDMPAPKPPALVLSVDQGEELFLAEGAEEAEKFLTVLKDLSTATAPDVIILVAIRSDSYERLQMAKALEGVKQDAMSLPPLPHGSYADVIEGPARRLKDTPRALKIEPALTQALLTDIEAGGAKDALPLLAFTLERLYVEYGGDGDLRLSEYEQLGRVKGSIEAAVASALAAADADSKIPKNCATRLALLRRGLIPWLAGIDPETGSPRRRVARLSEIPEKACPLVQLLVEQRLLATDVATATGEVTIEPAHEALLRQWGLLQTWLVEDSAVLTTLESVKRAARDWEANGKDAAWLTHGGGRLEDANRLRLRPDLAGLLAPADWTYLDACSLAQQARDAAEKEEQERRIKDAERIAEEQKKAAAAQKRTARVALIGVAVVSIFSGFAVWQYLVANREKNVATSRELAAQARVNLDTRAPHDLRLALKSISIAQQAGSFSPVESRQLLDAILSETGGVPLQHEAEIAVVEFSPDDHWLATASADTVRLWDMQAPSAAPKTLRGPAKINALAFSPDGRTLATVGEDSSVRLWDMVASDLKAGPQVLTGHSARWLDVGFSRDGGWLATASADGEAQLWKWPGPTSASSWILPHGKGHLYALAFSPDSKWLATGSDDASVRMWNLLDSDPSANPKALKTVRGWDIKLVFSPNSRWLASGGSGGDHDPLLLWNVAALEGAFHLKGVPWVGALAFSPDGHWLVTPGQYNSRGEYGTRLLWDLNKSDPSEEPMILPGHNYLSDLAFSPDGTWLATGSTDFTVRLWNTTDNLAPPAILRGHEGPISQVTFSHDGRHMVSVSKDLTARLWTLSSPNAEPVVFRTRDGATKLNIWDMRAAELPPLPLILDDKQLPILSGTVFSPDGKWIAAVPASDDHGDVYLISMSNSTHYLVNHPGGLLATPVFSPDGHWLATGGSGDPTIRLWDLRAPDPTSSPRALSGHTQPVRSLAFSADGHRLVSGARDGFAYVWDLTAPDPSKAKTTLAGGDIRAVAISADGRYVVTGSWEPDYEARIWDLSSQPSFKSPIRLAFKGRVFDVAISPDSRWVAAGSWDFTTQLLDLTRPNAKPKVMRGHTARTLSVSFSPDSHWLATGNEDQSASLWNLDDERNLETEDVSADSIVLHAPYGVGNVSFSHDGRWLALGQSEYRTSPFSPDGHWFASTNAGDRLFHVSLEDLISLACQTAGRTPTEDEWGQSPSEKVCPVAAGSQDASKMAQ
jgi:WD40 repeat protein